MSIQTSSAGIFQGDVIIRTAIQQGIRELRKKPELLDYCFASLPQDELTATDYGQGTVDRAKEWFRTTDVAVKINLAINSPKLPAVSIELQQCQEAEATLGDVHYDPTETDDSSWPDVTPAFACTSYDPDTGHVGLPSSVTDSTLVFPGMVLIDRRGNAFPIVGTIDESTVRIDPAVADLSLCTLRYGRPANITSLESLSFRGTFAIGCHVQGEIEQLIWLASIIQFILLRYKQSYFEARGFERSTIQISGIARDPSWDQENVYTQYINITGYYRNYWPKAMGPRAQGLVAYPIKIADGPQSPFAVDPNQAPWVMEEDSLADLKYVGIKGQDEE